MPYSDLDFKVVFIFQFYVIVKMLVNSWRVWRLCRECNELSVGSQFSKFRKIRTFTSDSAHQNEFLMMPFAHFVHAVMETHKYCDVWHLLKAFDSLSCIIGSIEHSFLIIIVTET